MWHCFVEFALDEIVDERLNSVVFFVAFLVRLSGCLSLFVLTLSVVIRIRLLFM